MSDSEDESRNKNLKVVLIGDGSSGKVRILWTIFLIKISHKPIRK